MKSEGPDETNQAKFRPHSVQIQQNSQYKLHLAWRLCYSFFSVYFINILFFLLPTMIFATGGSSEDKEEFADLRTDDANALTKESDIM